MNCEIDQQTGRQIHDHCYDCTNLALEWARERLSRLSEENALLGKVLEHCFYAVVGPSGPLYGVDQILIDEIELALAAQPTQPGKEKS